MENEVVQKKLDKLLNLVYQMRKYQADYFKYRSSDDLNKARKKEREVDAFLQDEKKQRDSKQSELF